MRPEHDHENTGPGLLSTLWRQLPLVVVTALLVGGVTALALSQREPSYEATAQLLYSAPGPEAELLGTAQPQSVDQDRAAATNVVEVQSARVAERAARRLDLPAGTLRDGVAVAAATDSDVVEVTATASSSEEAARRADAYARAAISLSRAEQARRARAAAGELSDRYDSLSATQQRSGRGNDLEDRIDTLRSLAAIGTGSPRLIQRGAGATARTDSPARLIVLGAIFGLLVGAGLALLRARSDHRLRGDGVAEALDVPVLATVPRSRALRRGDGYGELPEADREAFRFLAGRLCFAGERRPRSVLVTSAREGEGKTATVAHLAAAAAEAGSRVLVVEADLRRPALGDRLGLESQTGLADVLRGDAQVADAIVGAREGFDVLLAGPADERDVSVLQRDAAGELMEWARDGYDLVIVDSAPLGSVADAMPLLAKVDGVILATFLDLSDEGEVRRVRWQVSEMGGRVLGVVVGNARGAASESYGPRPAAIG